MSALYCFFSKKVFYYYSLISFVLLLMNGAHLAQAQVSKGGMPYSFLHQPEMKPPAAAQMPAFDVVAMLAEDALTDGDKQQPYRFGKDFEVDFSLNNSGSWLTLPNGDRIWRLAITSSQARFITLQYSHYYLPKGATLYLYNADYSSILGAFTHENNKSYLKFATGIIKGEQTILEYYEPAAVQGQGIIHIDHVIHAYRGFDSLEKDYNDSGSCNNNVNCPEGDIWKKQISSVAMILQGNYRFCSGAMINNVRNDCTPLFLTANHCYQGTGSTQTWIFMFNYQSSGCNNQDGATNQTVSGATVLANNAATDFVLLQLDEEIPVEYDIYFSGWSAQNVAGTAMTCIHHPAGDIKKITFDDDGAVATSGSSGVSQAFWRINQWEDGTTEGGSSGSPLYDQNQRVVGQLFGGEASCNFLSYDEFGSLAKSWSYGNTPNKRLKEWLDPDNSGTLVIDGKSCALPEIAINASLLPELIAPTAVFCKPTPTLQVKVRNEGAQNIESMVLKWSINGGDELTTEWTGNLAYSQETEIVLAENVPIAVGTQNLTVTVLQVNSQTDGNVEDNVQTFTLTRTDEQWLSIEFQSDQTAAQNNYTIRNEAGQVVASGNNFSNNQFYNLQHCLPKGCYTFTLTDSGNNGICCENGNGNYALFNGEGDVLGFGGDFTNSISVDFCLGDVLTAQLSSNQQGGCAPTAIQFYDQSSGNPDTWQWTFEGGSPAQSNEANPQVIYNQSGTFDVSLTVRKGAFEKTITMPDYIQIDEVSNVQISIQNTTLGAATGSIQVSADNLANASLFDAQNQAMGSLTGLAAGDYILQLTDAQACQSTQNITIKVEVSNDLGADIIPNLVQSQLIAYHDLDAAVQLDIYAANGQWLYKQTLPRGYSYIEAKQIFPVGMYVAVLRSGDKQITKKIVIQ
ncbi:MAG: T9SS type A sorting domain-containing protein [Sphingobacteriales bacterium]|nr:T9SS type A sorting domain-containing protein [Sphingobacteriales bacterium]